MKTFTESFSEIQSNSESDSVDSYERQELEFALYSQIYHDSREDFQTVEQSKEEPQTAINKESENSSREVVEEKNNGFVLDTKGRRFEKAKLLALLRSPNKSLAPQVIDSDIEILDEFVPVRDESDSDDSECKVIKTSLQRTQQGMKRKRSAISTSDKSDTDDSSDDDDEEDMPFWSHIDSGTHQTDSTLQVHLHTHGSGRKRLDSTLSITSLGENKEDLVTILEPTGYGSIDEVLTNMPDDGWEISHLDYKISNLSVKSPLRYHNLECRNCRKRGHLSRHCPELAKKRCVLCSEIHPNSKIYQLCPDIRCTSCHCRGHEGKDCKKARDLRNSTCLRCGSKGHHAPICHELWRQWHSTTEIGSQYPVIEKRNVVNPNKQCASCGVAGHYTHECHNLQWWQSPKPAPIIRHYNQTGALVNFDVEWARKKKNPFNNNSQHNFKSSKWTPSGGRSELFSLPYNPHEEAVAWRNPEQKEKSNKEELEEVRKQRKLLNKQAKQHRKLLRRQARVIKQAKASMVKNTAANSERINHEEKATLNESTAQIGKKKKTNKKQAKKKQKVPSPGKPAKKKITPNKVDALQTTPKAKNTSTTQKKKKKVTADDTTTRKSPQKKANAKKSKSTTDHVSPTNKTGTKRKTSQESSIDSPPNKQKTKAAQASNTSPVTNKKNSNRKKKSKQSGSPYGSPIPPRTKKKKAQT